MCVVNCVFFLVADLIMTRTFLLRLKVRNMIGVGRLHTNYEAYIDSKASDRQLKPLGPPLLCRPETHGTILVMKTTS